MKKYIVICLLVLATCLCLSGCGDLKSDNVVDDFKKEIAENLEETDVLQSCTVYNKEEDSESEQLFVYVEADILGTASEKKQYYKMTYSKEKGKYVFDYIINDRRDEWTEIPLSKTDDATIDSIIRTKSYYYDGAEIKDYKSQDSKEFQLLDYSIINRETVLEEGKDTFDIILSGICMNAPVQVTIQIELKFYLFDNDEHWAFSSMQCLSSVSPDEAYIGTFPTLDKETVAAGLAGRSFKLGTYSDNFDPYMDNEPTNITLSEENVKDITINGEIVFGEKGMQSSGSVIVDYGFAEFDLPMNVFYSYNEDGTWNTYFQVLDYSEIRWKLIGTYTGAYQNSNYILAITEQNENSLKAIFIRKNSGSLENIWELEGELNGAESFSLKSTGNKLTNGFQQDLNFYGVFDYEQGRIIENGDRRIEITFTKDADSPSSRLLHTINFDRYFLLCDEDDYLGFIAEIKEQYNLDVLFVPYIYYSFGSNENEIKENLTTLYHALNLGYDDEKSGFILAWDNTFGFVYIPIGRCEEILTTEISEYIKMLLPTLQPSGAAEDLLYELDEAYIQIFGSFFGICE